MTIHADDFLAFKFNPTKIKLDCRLLSGFCMESAVPLEDGFNVKTFGVVVGKRVGKPLKRRLTGFFMISNLGETKRK